ncbi:hypothetical protein HK099_008530 [Clydaea vesicula]|uniref:U1 small nuclear ribonucleoprotein 70 kDa n=1 Tax=Clydaea vesicula TaxID=447962 RepID=A0AAD5XXW4_9FUNG|nr:hypothetical protein HK099_008530 [Clydaea vesicula]
MSALLPPQLLKLFAARPPLAHLPPVDSEPGKRNLPKFTGLADYLEKCKGHDPDFKPTETWQEKKERLKQEAKAKSEAIIAKNIVNWDPKSDPNVKSEPYKTLFVARLNYDTTEKTLKRAFEEFGTVKSIRMVKDINSGKPKGYAFIEFKHEEDMKIAYRETDGMKIDGRRILVDCERGRTVKGWRPRRLGGGLGGTRIGGPSVNTRFSGREAANDRPVRRESHHVSSHDRYESRSRDHRDDRRSSSHRDERSSRRDDRHRSGSRHGGYDDDRDYKREESSRSSRHHEERSSRHRDNLRSYDDVHY